MALIEKVCLYHREGASDKVYEIHLTQEEDGFCVTGYNGRRGTKLVAQPKTLRPVPYRMARYIFNNLEAAKLNHRRTPYHIASRETNTPQTQERTVVQSSDEIKPSTPPEGYQATWLDALEF